MPNVAYRPQTSAAIWEEYLAASREAERILQKCGRNSGAYLEAYSRMRDLYAEYTGYEDY